MYNINGLKVTSDIDFSNKEKSPYNISSQQIKNDFSYGSGHGAWEKEEPIKQAGEICRRYEIITKNNNSRTFVHIITTIETANTKPLFVFNLQKTRQSHIDACLCGVESFGNFQELKEKVERKWLNYEPQFDDIIS